MKKTYLILFGIFIISSLLGQSGCTDINAINYDSSAVYNDGSCIYAETKLTPAFKTILNWKLAESSGLVWTDGAVWSHNDSKNEAAIYKIDTTNGNVLQTVYIDNFDNIDWEDITADSFYIYIGDFGNNIGTRKDLKILRISKSQINNESSIHLKAEAINFYYPDQIIFTADIKTNFDCESLISFADSLYLFTKNHGDYRSSIYKIPKLPGTYSAQLLETFYTQGEITGADISPDKKEIILLGYLSGNVNSFLWHLTDFTGNNFFSGNKHRIEISNGKEWKTEGIAFLNNSIWLSNETTFDVQQSLFTLNKNSLINDNKTSIISYSIIKSINVYPNPSKSGDFYIQVENEIIDKISAYDISGRQLQIELFRTNEKTTSIKITDYIGILYLEIKLKAGSFIHKMLLSLP